MSIYLDNAASAPISFIVKKWVIDHLDMVGNPSSPHSYGLECRNIIESSRREVARYLGCRTDNIIFTSGASQANTLALTYPTKKVFESKIEHSSIMEWIRQHEDNISGHPISVDKNGVINLDSLENALRHCTSGDDALVVIQWANNEIGTIQDINTIADLVHAYGAKLFVDATQIFPWIHSMDLQSIISKADMLSASAHKCGGLPGCGILYKKSGIQLTPVVYGHQEHGLVGGTENTLAIGAFGEALKHQPSKEEMLRVQDIRNQLFDELEKSIPGISLNGPALTNANRLPHNLNIVFRGVNSDVLVSLLDSCGIACSGGSACNSHILSPSHVLKAIGLSDKYANQSVRLSIPLDFTEIDVQNTIKKIKYNVLMARKSFE